MEKIFVLGLFLVMMACATCDATFTKERFKAMRIKELRAFLSDRGLSCNGCQEKDDFVKMAFENRDKKITTGVEKREIPNTTFWEAWNSETRQKCAKIVEEKHEDPTSEPFVSVCSTVASAVESFLMQHGKSLAQKLKKRPESILKTSYTGVYYNAGSYILDKLVKYCLSPSMRTTCTSLTSVMDIIEKGKVSDFKNWLMNVAIENTNPMYEVLNPNTEL